MIPKSIQAAFYHLLKLKPFCKAKLLKNGSSHTGGASTRMPQYLSDSLEEEEAVCCSQTNHVLQQLHIWQVVSCSKHCVRVACVLTQSMLLLTFICSSTTKIWWVFFTSLPIEQIMVSVSHFVTRYAAKQNADFSEISFTVHLAATEPKLRVFQGQFRRHKIRTGVIWLRDLCQLCELSLHTSLFSQSLQAANRIGHWQSDFSFIGRYCCLLLGA